jgi:predicted Zn-dependent peptidase
MRKILPVLLALAAAAPLAAARLRLPAFSRQVLPNGLTLEVMQRKGVPLVEIDVAVKGGIESDPAEQPGLAEVTGELLRKGTAIRSSDQFSNDLDALGGRYRIRAGAQSTLLQSEFLTKDFRAGLALIADAVLHPTFPEPEVEKLLAQQIDMIRATKDNPAEAMEPYAHAFFFGVGHPYGRPMTEASILHMNRDSIAQYHKRMYSGRNLVIAVVGDIDPRRAIAEVERAFNSAPAGEAYKWMKPVRLERPAQARLLLVDNPEATQAYFYIVQPGIDAKSPDRVPASLVNTLFGGRFTSVLNEELRVKSGLTYGARNFMDEDRLQGMNAISTFTKTDSTGEAVALSLQALKDLNEHGVNADQLASAKAYEQGVIPREQLETPEKLATLLLRLEVLGFGPDEVNTLFQRMDAVTVAEANIVARKYFETSGLTFIFIGDAKKIRAQVAQFAPEIKQVEISTPGFGGM